MTEKTLQKTNYGALSTLTTVFFFWGFVAASNTILIGLFKEKFDLLQWQSQLVEFAFYTAYFVGSLIYFLLSTFGKDPLQKYGSKKGLIGGLLISAVGALGFVPAAELSSFWLMLISLFTVGIGFSLLQIVANPYVIALGDTKTGAHRVSLAGGVNSIGTMLGPIIFNSLIFGKISGEETNSVTIVSVELPYIILTVCFVVLAFILSRAKLPNLNSASKEEVVTTKESKSVFKYPQLILGMIAIFVYVGVEVSIQSNLPSLMEQPDILGMKPEHTAQYISLYWGSLMIGRWLQSIGVFNISGKKKVLLQFIIAFVAFGVIIGSNWLMGTDVSNFYQYWPFVLLLILTLIVTRDKTGLSLIVFSLLGLIMMVCGMFTEGFTAVLFFVSGGLFCSIMWPCIFSLSIAGLGDQTTKGSSLLVMMIFGGAIIPPIQGYLGDEIGIHNSYWLPVVCFAYLAFFAWFVGKTLKKQGVDFE
ncbi:MAG TPA: MFS transporter [Crocinitomicaceae bacterium]|nr:MFS transporter [Crocinitomicaceae bacterium]